MNESYRNIRDIQLVKHIRKSNEKAFTDLFEAYYDPLCDFAYRFVRDTEIMEDVVQDVFVWIWENRICWNLKPGVTVRAYLSRAVHNRIVTKVRKKRFETPLDDYNQNNIEFTQTTQIEDINHRDFWKAVGEVLELLPERRREIIILSLMEGHTYKEIALILDISVNTVHTQIKRALKLLRFKLNPFLPNENREKAV